MELGCTVTSVLEHRSLLALEAEEKRPQAQAGLHGLHPRSLCH